MRLMEASGKIMLENKKGELKMEKVVILIESDSFTEVEAVATEHFNSLTNYKENTELNAVKKVNICDVLFNEKVIDDNGPFKLVEYTSETEDTKFWELTVAFTEITDDDKEKIVKSKYIIPADSLIEAIHNLTILLKDCTLTWEVIGSKKTGISSILVTEDTDRNLQEKFSINIAQLMQISNRGNILVDQSVKSYEITANNE